MSPSQSDRGPDNTASNYTLDDTRRGTTQQEIDTLKQAAVAMLSESLFKKIQEIDQVCSFSDVQGKQLDQKVPKGQLFMNNYLAFKLTQLFLNNVENSIFLASYTIGDSICLLTYCLKFLKLRLNVTSNKLN